LCALAAITVRHAAPRTELDGAPYGGYWGGNYDSGYYGAYNNPYALDVARQDYWDAMNSYDAAGVWSYNEWVDQRRDWDAAGYGYGPYDSQVHADFWRSADQNGWGDQTRYNNYLSSYNAEAGGEYPYGYPSVQDNYEWQGGGYPSIADNFEQRGGLYRRASDMKDSNHQGHGLTEADGKGTVATKADRTISLAQKFSKRARKHWKPMSYKQMATVHLGNNVPAATRDEVGEAKGEAKAAYHRAAATFRHAYPGAPYRKWLEATAKWDQFFVHDRVLDSAQVQLDERKAAALINVLPTPTFPALRQIEQSEEERVRVPHWEPALHLGPVCRSTQLWVNGRTKTKKWQNTPACTLCRDEGSDCDKCAANAKQMLCQFVTMPKAVPKSLLHFTPMGDTDVKPSGFSFSASEHGTQLTQIKAEAREQHDVASEKFEEQAAREYSVVDEALSPLNALQANLNQARVRFYVSEFGERAMRLLSGPAFAGKLPQLSQAGPGFLRWRLHPAVAARHLEQQKARAAKGHMVMLAQKGDCKLCILGVNLGGNPLDYGKRVRQHRATLQQKTLTTLAPATSGSDHYSTPGDFHLNCEGDSPTGLCDRGVFVGEQVPPSSLFCDLSVMSWQLMGVMFQGSETCSPPCSVLQRVAVCFSALQCYVVCCSVLQCIAVCCSRVWSYASYHTPYPTFEMLHSLSPSVHTQNIQSSPSSTLSKAIQSSL